MNDKKYSIKGVDFRTELIIGFSIVPFILIFGQTAVSLYSSFKNVEFRNIPFFVFLGGVATGMGIGLFVAKILGKKMSSLWHIELNDHLLNINFKNKKWSIKLNEITKLKIYGNPKFKYVTISNNNENIKIRIGNSGLTPFSTSDDLKEVDDFIRELQGHFNKNYVKKDGTVKQSQLGTVKLTYLKK